MEEKKRRILRKTSAYTALISLILIIITGYGITQYRFVEQISFGLLHKSLSFKLHNYLMIPLAVSILSHLYFSNIFRVKK